MAGRPLAATNVGKAPLRARGGVVVEQDVEDYRRSVELIAKFGSCSGGTVAVSSSPPTTPLARAARHNTHAMPRELFQSPALYLSIHSVVK